MPTDSRRFDWRWKGASLLLMVLAVSLLHYGTQTTQPLLHDVYRRLYYLPVGLSAVWFGLRGGLVMAMAVAAVYVPHIVMQWGGESREVVNRVLEVGVFFLFAGVAGYFADREGEYRHRWKRVAENLEKSYGQLRGQADQILQIENQLRRADRLSTIGELAASMTHEIRNPLGSIKGAAEILRDPATPPAARVEFLEILLRETGRLDQVVEDFLGYARDQRSAGCAGAVDLGELAEETLPLVETQAREAGVSVSARVPGGVQVLGIPHQLKQVLLNLLLNAVQATPGGRAVQLTGSVEGGRVVLAVEDEGPGLAIEQRQRVFEPFFTTKEEGTGLGLAISQRIAGAHGGTLTVENRPQGGARFVLALPLFDQAESAPAQEGFVGRN
ncbi:MAG: ATP-binding protein [Deferrisomatales bacterium]|nr:ATP-binding protein [Deferrisomatales bacterium]